MLRQILTRQSLGQFLKLLFCFLPHLLLISPFLLPYILTKPFPNIFQTFEHGLAQLSLAQLGLALFKMYLDFKFCLDITTSQQIMPTTVVQLRCTYSVPLTYISCNLVCICICKQYVDFRILMFVLWGKKQTHAYTIIMHKFFFNISINFQ